MAGPGFDHNTIQPDHKSAAQNVQCLHTSRDKGTRFYNCHQDWRLGNCGYAQIAASDPPFGSHGLCPYMYVSSFENNFYAIDKPAACASKQFAAFWPQKYKMGYMETRKWSVLFNYIIQCFLNFTLHCIYVVNHSFKLSIFF